MRKKYILIAVLILIPLLLTGCLSNGGASNKNPVIKSLNLSSQTMRVDESIDMSVQASDPDGDKIGYSWSVDKGQISGSGANITYQAPSKAGTYEIKVLVSDGNGGKVTTTKEIQVASNDSPVINSVTLNPTIIQVEETATITVDASDPEGDSLIYAYSVSNGSISGTGSSVTYTAPSSTGTYTIEVTVSDGSNNVSTYKEITVTPVVWQQTYTGGEGQRVFETVDGSYLAVDDSFQVVKVDSKGNKLWSNDYIADTAVTFKDMKETSDNGALLIGDNYSTGEIHLVKIDSLGNQLWSKTYVENVDLNAVIETASGNYLVVGTDGDYSTDYQISAIKFDPQGNKLWSKTYGSSTIDEYGASIIETTNGYLLAGYKYNGTDNDIYAVKIDSAGTKQWEKSYSTAGNQEVNSILEVNGDYILAGYTDQAGYDNAYLMKIDSLGAKQWEKTYGGTDDDLFHDIEKTLDGNYIAVGTTRSFASNRVDYYLVKLDSQFNELWHKAYGLETYDRSYDVDVVSNGGYILGGYDAIDHSIYLVKTDSQGNTGSLPQ